MARATTSTWLPPDRWAEIMGISPFSFNQLTAVPPLVIPTSECGEVWFQHMWQEPDQASREDVGDAIREAELKLASAFGFYLLPDWVEDERVNTVRPARPELFASTVGNVRGQSKSIESRWNYVVSGGRKAKDAIEEDVDIFGGGVLSDQDGDGFLETITITVNVAAHPGITACEVRVYYPDTEAVVLAPALDQWEIRPINVTLVGNTATIVFKRWQVVVADIQERLNAVALPASAASFMDTVDVYRVFNDPQSMATLLWETGGVGGCAVCAGAGCTACSFDSQVGCFLVRDERRGILAYHPATWDAALDRFTVADFVNCRDPDQLRIWYYAGWQADHPSIDCPRVQLDPYFEKVIAYYAAALLDRAVCSCNNSERFVDHWREDLARLGTDVSHQLSVENLDNPLGTQRGAIYAWKQVKRWKWRVHA